jgi:hypothetical protein
MAKSSQNRNESVPLEDLSKLEFRPQYSGAEKINIRANGKFYPTNKDAILKRISISGAKYRDLRFFTDKSIVLAKKKT